MVLRGPPGNLRHACQPAPAGNARLARGKQPPSTLVALRAVQFPPLPNRLSVSHPRTSNLIHDPVESSSHESHCRSAKVGKPIHLLLGVALLRWNSKTRSGRRSGRSFEARKGSLLRMRKNPHPEALAPLGDDGSPHPEALAPLGEPRRTARRFSVAARSSPQS